MYTALVAASQTIRDFLTARLRADTNLRTFFDPAFGGNMVVSLNTPDEMDRLHLHGLSLWLYRVVRDENLLNAPPQKSGVLQYRHTALPVRLHYLITPLVDRAQAAGSELEQIVLGKVLQSLHDHACFRGPDLQGDFQGHAEVELFLRLEPMALEEITRVWTALLRSYELCVSYEVSVTSIRSELVEDYGAVESVLPRTAAIVTSQELG
jgi:hypothetical protein